ncbi:peptidylprolyl isomerase [Pseudooceanicola sediminis]|uniref:Parvulin-like PPIase n=1 Tax=Pseudooceanicola sediminis TaxID=2211117 RepID=A0A399J344_9RHOB|nr:peptidyl-prolyl cis-trans isomerase [Pseudooceanicola sediminis]KAA2317327.1 peptidylprolyl isomerase [Puniceibacterium sp. HSS470]RII39681.1 peptidylprolyl isomerase [Pseudooceanicola sediminis]|tara:strand:+ start:3043 stop:4881 length:1839 start_codon:yes stop_codon:yes gene_type:complete
MAMKKSNMLVWGLLVLLVLGLGGFGATNFTGNVTNIGEVGGKPIRINAYTRGVQDQMAQLQQQMGQPISFAQAQAFGITNSVVAGLVNDRALDNEADRLGLSIGDEELRDQIVKIPAFQDATGKFSRESYTFALDRAGISEAEFESDMRSDSARSMLQAAVIAATRMPAVYSDTLANYVAEQRTVTYATLTPDGLDTPVPTPTDEQLQTFYDANIADYTAPEKKRITYAELSPDMMMDQVQIDDDTIRAQYEARIDEFEQPERRLVERLVFPDENAAEAAKAKLDSGESDFDTLVSDRGLALSDVDLGDLGKDDLGAAGDAVFAAQQGDVVGPLDSDLGPALFRVNGVLQASSTDYDEAAETIRTDLAADAARRLVAQQMEPVEDLLAGGATLEDVAKETPLQLGTIDWSQGMSEGIAGYADFASAAADVTAEDYPTVTELDDGGLFALRLDEVIPAAPIPLAETRDKVAEDWTTAETEARLRAKAETLVATLRDGTPLEDLGLTLTTETNVSRNGSVLGTPQGFNQMVFAMQEGDVQITDGLGSVLIVRLDQIVPPAEDDSQTAELRKSLSDQVSSSLAQDIYQAYSADVRARTDVRINQEALNAVNAQMQ